MDTLPLFSVPTLVYQLSVIGKTDEIDGEIQFWSIVQKAVMQAKINAQEWAIKFCQPENIRKLRDEGFLFELNNCPGVNGVFVEANEMQVRALFGEIDDSAETQLMTAIFGAQAIGQKFGLIINQAKSGNYAILPGGLSLDLVWVYNRLRGLERQIRKETSPQTETLIWHLDVKGAPKRQRHQLLNGSPGWPLPASKIFPKSVIRFVHESAYFMDKRPAGEKK